MSSEYPFSEDVRISVAADRPLSRPLHLRVPGWSRGASSQNADGDPELLVLGTMRTVEAGWITTPIELRLHLPAPVEVHGIAPVTVTSGPPLLTLPLEKRWEVLQPRRWMTDWTVSPRSRWQRALVGGSVDAQRQSRPGVRLDANPLTPAGARIGVTAQAQDISS